MNSIRTLLASLSTVAFLALATPTVAAPGADAQQLFTDAQSRFDKRDFAAALPLFEQALQVSGSPNARLYVARCLRELGRYAEAYDQMYATTREATSRAEEDPKYVQTRDSAAAELALLEPKVGKLIVVWTGADGATVKLDAKEVAADKLGSPITVAAGEHIVAATAPDGKAIEQKVQIDGGQTKTVTLSAAGASAPSEPQQGAGSTPPPTSPEPDEEATGGGVRVAGFVVTGLGVAGMVLFAVGGSLAQGEYGTLEDECGDVRCSDPKYGDVVDKGKTWELVANVSLGVGIAAIVGGVAMIIFGGPSEPEAATAAEPAAAGRGGVDWAFDVGPVPGAGATVGARATF